MTNLDSIFKSRDITLSTKIHSSSMRWLDGIPDSMDMSLSKLGDCGGQGGLVCYTAWGHKEWDVT